MAALLFVLLAAVISGGLYLLPSVVLDYLCYVGLAFSVLIMCWNAAELLSSCLPKRRVSPTNKAVLITGCTSGFGLLLAKKLYDAGFLVFAGCRKPHSEGAEELRKFCAPDRLHIIPLDVNVDNDVRKAVKEVKSKLPNGTVLWAVVNNAGYARVTSVEFSGMEAVYEHMEPNAIGPYRVTKAFLPLLRESKGKVVVMSSIGTRVAFPGFAAYTMSKVALVAFTDCLRREMRPWGIRVICLEPVLYKTRLAEENNNIGRLIEDWESAPQELRNEYSERMSPLGENVLATIRFALKRANTDIDTVVNAMKDAVVCIDYPDKRIVGPFYERFFFWMLPFLPKSVVDFVMIAVFRKFFF